MLRRVDETRATIWVETDAPCVVRVLDASTRTFTAFGHHYALAVVTGLEPGSSTPYAVHLDDDLAWPNPDSPYPPSVIRTLGEAEPVTITFGSCRASAPHEPPFTLERTIGPESRGVDALWAVAHRMLDQSPAEWPDLLVMAGDQIYADDSSPQARERIDALRDDDSDLDPAIVANFEEYTWLYREAWQPPLERWLFSVVPSVMIFDDHDMIDDWNISESWVADIRAEPWWRDHVIGGIASYWIHQHLGNLSPERIDEEGMLARLLSVEDGTEVLRSWSEESEKFTPVPGGYQFSYSRQVGDVTLVVIDCRNGRVLEPGSRAMVDAGEWRRIVEHCRAAEGHLVLVTSLPVFVPDGLHDLQVWSERICDGAWGSRAARLGERLRRGLDLEDWSAFQRSYDDMTTLLVELANRPELRTVTVLSGDIHFSYVADVPLSGLEGGNRVNQVVSSPLRNALIPPERGVIRFTLTRFAARLGRLLRRSVRAKNTAPHITLRAGPFFNNNIGHLTFEAEGDVGLEQALVIDDEPGLRPMANLRL